MTEAEPNETEGQKSAEATVAQLTMSERSGLRRESEAASLAPSSVLVPSSKVVRPGAPSSVLALSSEARSP